MHCTELAGQFSRNCRLSRGWQAAKDDEHSELWLPFLRCDTSALFQIINRAADYFAPGLPHCEGLRPKRQLTLQIIGSFAP